MKQNKWLIDRAKSLDDEAFVEFVGELTERSVDFEEKPNDEIIHISEVESTEGKWISTGYSTIDDKIRGLGQGHVILIGGETSNGKSALATNIAVNVSKKESVLFITLEMVQHELKKRIELCNNGTVDGLDISMQKQFRITYKDLKPLFERAKATKDIKLVVLDYLQYLGRGMTLDEVSRMSKEIKTLALDFQIPVIVIVSLRKNEAGKNKRKWTEIEIEDLMGTASIGYDCDTAIIASRKDLENQFDPDHIYVKVLKTRNSAIDYHDRYIELDWKETKITEDWSIPVKKAIDN